MELVGRLKPKTPVEPGKPTYMYTYIHTYIQTYIYTYLHTYIPTYLHTGKPLCDKDAVVDFIPSDPRAPHLLVPRLECPFR